MQYVDADFKDVPQIVELCQSGFPYLKNTNLLTKLFELYAKRGILIVAKTDRAIGYIAARPNLTFFKDAFELKPSLLLPGRLGLIVPWHLRLLFAKGAYLASMSVEPEFRGQGVAKSLMQLAMQRLEQKEIFVEIEGTNNPMSKIVQKLGFTRLITFFPGRELWCKS